MWPRCAAARGGRCIGKRALYRTLAKYSPRIELGLSGYNQYYQLTTRPSTLGTQCTYDRVALGYTPWGAYTFGPVLDDLDTTGPAGPTGLAAAPFAYTPPGLSTSHSTRKWVVQTGASGDVISKNVGNGPGGAGSQMTVTLAAGGVSVRVVSMPSTTRFEAQQQAYRDEVLPPGVTARVSVEAGATFGWERWVGDGGSAFGIDHFGASAPAHSRGTFSRVRPGSRAPSRSRSADGGSRDRACAAGGR